MYKNVAIYTNFGEDWSLEKLKYTLGGNDVFKRKTSLLKGK